MTTSPVLIQLLLPGPSHLFSSTHKPSQFTTSQRLVASRRQCCRDDQCSTYQQCWPSVSVWQQVIQLQNPTLKSVSLDHSQKQASQVRFPGKQTLKQTLACGRFIGRRSRHQHLPGREGSMFGAQKQVGLHCRHNRSLSQSHSEFWNLWFPKVGQEGSVFTGLH